MSEAVVISVEEIIAFLENGELIDLTSYRDKSMCTERKKVVFYNLKGSIMAIICGAGSLSMSIDGAVGAEMVIEKEDYDRIVAALNKLSIRSKGETMQKLKDAMLP